jgi:hypothetical protein
MYNENGSIIIVALVMALLLTLLGIMALNASRLDVEIASNEKVYNEAFYYSEGAVRAILPVLEDIRNGNDPGLISYTGLAFPDKSDGFWDEAVDDQNRTPEKNYDVIIAGLNNAPVDVDRLTPENIGASMLNRSGYEGCGKGNLAGWAASYRIQATGTSGKRAACNITARVDLTR